jgi:hypothetical protein
MLSNRKENLSTLGNKSAGQKPVFQAKGKGTVLSDTPGLNPALKALAFHGRKKFKLG